MGVVAVWGGGWWGWVREVGVDEVIGVRIVVVVDDRKECLSGWMGVHRGQNRVVSIRVVRESIGSRCVAGTKHHSISFSCSFSLAPVPSADISRSSISWDQFTLQRD